MTELTDGQGATPSAAEAQSAGTRLRLAREAAQMSIDDVAQQLKLARRQVLAIENDDVDALPGPTFVRGFIRNYARLLRIDAAPLIDANRAAGAPPTGGAIATPLEPTVTMSELPSHSVKRGGVARWIIPTGLVLLLAAGIAFYEFSGVGSGSRKAARNNAPESAASKSAGSTEAGTSPVTSDQQAASTAGTAGEKAAPPETRAPFTKEAGASNGPATGASTPATPAQPGAAPAAAIPAAANSNSSPGAAAGTGVNPIAIAAPQPGTTPEGRLEMEFAGPSWVEVRDKYGAVLISRTIRGKTRQVVTGELPFTMRVGNASAVRVVLDGRPVDLTPFTRGEIARVVIPSARP